MQEEQDAIETGRVSEDDGLGQQDSNLVPSIWKISLPYMCWQMSCKAEEGLKLFRRSSL